MRAHKLLPSSLCVDLKMRVCNLLVLPMIVFNTLRAPENIKRLVFAAISQKSRATNHCFQTTINVCAKVLKRIPNGYIPLPWLTCFWKLIGLLVFWATAVLSTHAKVATKPSKIQLTTQGFEVTKILTISSHL